MTRKHIGRIGVTLGLALGIAGCSALDGPDLGVARGEGELLLRAKPNDRKRIPRLPSSPSMTVPDRHRDRW